MKKTLLFAATMLAAGTISIGCKSSAEHEAKEKENATEMKKDAQTEYAEDVQKFRTEANAKISENEKTIAELKAKTANAKKETKAKYNKAIADIEQKNTELKNKLAEYKADGKDRWASFKTDFNHSMDEIGQSFKNLTTDDKK